MALPLLLALALSPPARAASILFDATRREMAGNADWVIDADAHDASMPAFPCSGSTLEANPQRYPTPPQSGVTGATPETYWSGGISAWAIDLVKAGHTVETLPLGAAITHGDLSNPQDLSRYALFIVVEPQSPFTAAEKTAILAFVGAGGALFMVADHETSDRDCDGWDSPHVWNDLTGATSAAAAGVFGIWFRVDGLDTHPSEDWFDEPIGANVSDDLSDPVIHGPFGPATGGLGLFGSTSMDLNLADNETVRAHVWRNGQPHDRLRVTFATASYGSGCVAAIGDSSPADDDTGDPDDNLHPGWDRASGGVDNREIHLNACAWLIEASPDTTAPAIMAGPSAAPLDCSADVTWTTDEPSTSAVEYGPTPGYGSTATSSGLVREHEVSLAGLEPSQTYHYRVLSSDSSGNGPTASDDGTFATAAPAPPALVSGPQASVASGSSAQVSWATNEPASGIVEYGTTPAYGSVVSAPALVADHAVSLGGLAPLTTYHYRVLAADACGNGPTASADGTFTTGPASLDVSGFTLRQHGSTQSFTFPPGTSIPAGGYLVVARDATQVEFEAAFPSMPPATVFLDSNASGSCAAGCLPQINGGESFELYDAGNVKLDGPTIAMAEENAYQRTRPGDPPSSAASWNVVAEAAANPGQGAGPGSDTGVVIGEMSDAPDYRKEFVELYYDAAPTTPDTIAPTAVADLEATPLSADTIRLTWSASGDDGATGGTASSYDVRMSTGRILTPEHFAAATPLAGEPAPGPPGSAESIVVGGLPPDAAGYFALAVLDEASNESAVSNDAWAVTAPTGSVPSVSHLVISQLRVSGTTDDVIEVYNPTADAVPLAGHSIQYLAANGNFGFRVNLNAAASVPSHGWHLVAGSGYAGPPARDDDLGGTNLSASAGHALLVSKTTNVTGCSDPAIVDRVGYGGAAVCPEAGAGHHAVTPGPGLSIVRKPGGSAGNGQDTDSNDADFMAPAAPSFHNGASPPATPPSSLGNVRATLYLGRQPSGTELRWGTAAGATGYHVYRGSSVDFMSSAPPAWASPSIDRIVDGESPAGCFYYVVRATDGASVSAD